MSFKLLIGASFGHYFQINGGLGWDGKKVSQKMAVVDKTIFKKLGGGAGGGCGLFCSTGHYPACQSISCYYPF